MRFFRAEVFRRDEGDAEIGQVKDSWTAVFEPAEVSVSERDKSWSAKGFLNSRACKEILWSLE